MSFEDYLLESNDVELTNWQTRLISGAGAITSVDEQKDLMLSTAKENLQKMAVVGITEYFDDSVERMADKFQWKSVSVSKKNTSSEGEVANRSLRPATLEKLQAMNELDRKLYDWQLQEFSSIVRST